MSVIRCEIAMTILVNASNLKAGGGLLVAAIVSCKYGKLTCQI